MLERLRWEAAAAVLTLGAAIGMNLAMFSLVDRALLSPPGSAAIAMLVVVVAATLVPARRASRADPNALLRTE